MLREDAAKPAPVTVSLKLKCTSCRTFMCLVKSVTASVTTGKRWRLRYKGKNIYDVLDMTVEEAVDLL